MEQMTKPNILRFIQYAIDKGLVKANTGTGWRSACVKILETVADDQDLAGLDVQREVLQFNNRHPGLLSPDSLAQYQGRVMLVLSEYAKWQQNPTTYKGVTSKTLGPRNGSKKPGDKAPAPALPVVAEQQVQPKQPHTLVATETSLVLPFPLRPSFLAQIVIPRDLTKDEATRLCTFIQALGQDAPMAMQS